MLRNRYCVCMCVCLLLLLQLLCVCACCCCWLSVCVCVCDRCCCCVGGCRLLPDAECELLMHGCRPVTATECVLLLLLLLLRVCRLVTDAHACCSPEALGGASEARFQWAMSVSHCVWGGGAVARHASSRTCQ